MQRLSQRVLYSILESWLGTDYTFTKQFYLFSTWMGRGGVGTGTKVLYYK